jgi:hypothetical protein
MAHFFDARTHKKTDFFYVKACSTISAGFWNEGGPPLTISSDDEAIAAVSRPGGSTGGVSVGAGVFTFQIGGRSAGSILIRAKNAAGNQWAFTQAVVSGADLCLHSTGSTVEELQKRLNCLSPTRLPRLATSGTFDLHTKVRVMEFQWQHKLKADGIVGKKTLGRLGTPTCATTSAPAGRSIVVDLVNYALHAYRDGVEEVTASPIRGGPSTHAGVFQMSSRRLRNHTSSTYPIPPGNMNFSLFFDGVKAIHEGPGSIESHGCIHVNPPYAERLFNWAGVHDVVVIVVK